MIAHVSIILASAGRCVTSYSSILTVLVFGSAFFAKTDA